MSASLHFLLSLLFNSRLSFSKTIYFFFRLSYFIIFFFFFFQAEDGIRDHCVTGVQTCALPILTHASFQKDRLLQIGARNAQNFQLLIECARSKKPILLKRGMSQRIEEWLLEIGRASCRERV